MWLREGRQAAPTMEPGFEHRQAGTWVLVASQGAPRVGAWEGGVGSQGHGEAEVTVRACECSVAVEVAERTLGGGGTSQQGKVDRCKPWAGNFPCEGRQGTRARPPSAADRRRVCRAALRTACIGRDERTVRRGRGPPFPPGPFE